MANPVPIFRQMQADGFESITYLQNQKIALNAIVCIHSTKHGPAHGGIRRKTYRSEQDALIDVMRLAHAMSRKAVMANIPAGGGKIVIMDHPSLSRRKAYETIGQYLDSLGDKFFTGPDVGTTERDLEAVRKFTRNVVAKETKTSSGHIADATAAGVIASIRATLTWIFGDPSPKNRHFAIQGLGSIGGRVAEWLYSSDAELTVTDVNEQSLKEWHNRARVVSPGRILQTKCDILSPNALGGVITAKTRLNCRAIVGAANNPLADDRAADSLHRRDILYAPDFVVNAGGLIQGAGQHLKLSQDTQSLIEGIENTVLTIFKNAKRQNKSPHRVAIKMADARL